MSTSGVSSHAEKEEEQFKNREKNTRRKKLNATIEKSQKPIGKTQICKQCKKSFPSKNSLFRHLRVNGEKCLNEAEHESYLASTFKSEKIAVLYGYIPALQVLQRSIGVEEDKVASTQILEDENDFVKVRGGETAASLVVEAIEKLQKNKKFHPNPDKSSQEQNDRNSKTSGINRSYGNVSRANDLVSQDEFTGASSEVLTYRASPLLIDDDHENSEGKSMKIAQEKKAIEKWVEEINSFIETNLLPDPDLNGSLRIFGRLSIPAKFNAELDVTHRKMEYLLPADFLYSNKVKCLCRHLGSRQKMLNDLPSFQPGYNPSVEQNVNGDGKRPEKETLQYLYGIKKIMQRLTTQIEKLDMNDMSAVMEKQFHDLKRKKNKSKSNEKHQVKRKRSQQQQQQQNQGVKSEPQNHVTITQKSDAARISGGKKEEKVVEQYVLRRKRYHNFTPGAMAHDFLSFRRMDRFHHCATFRYPNMDLNVNSTNSNATLRPFVLLTITGDQFLLGQVRGVIGLFLAVVRGDIDEDIIDCLFDEDYTSLVPTPPAPNRGFYARGATYTSWEGKAGMILNPRNCNRYQRGWNDQSIITEVEEWTKKLQRQLAKAWYHEDTISSSADGDREEEDCRLAVEREWDEKVLQPWVVKAKAQLHDYRSWKDAKEKLAAISTAARTIPHDTDTVQKVDNADSTNVVAATSISPLLDLLPPLESVDPSVPQVYQKVLHYLREANASEMWPTTTPKRQLVMSSTKDTSVMAMGSDSSSIGNHKVDDSVNKSSLSFKLMKARSNNLTESSRTSAYSYVEGQGGASGSFSVGAMPGEQCEQPRGNVLFPELMKAAFELEIAICPGREPSSTIAVNRNAQFRPHTDNGAGAGQSTSLIVGLGTYSGGELVVEGEKKDIHFKAIEFNGWTQRHWTLPFRGERYSLVWFTPKGCEGVRGIDLCTNISC